MTLYERNAKMTRNEIKDACKDLREGDEQTFTLDEGQSIKFLSGEITSARGDGLAVMLNRSENQVTASCYKPKQH